MIPEKRTVKRNVLSISGEQGSVDVGMVAHTVFSTVIGCAGNSGQQTGTVHKETNGCQGFHVNRCVGRIHEAAAIDIIHFDAAASDGLGQLIKIHGDHGFFIFHFHNTIDLPSRSHRGGIRAPPERRFRGVSAKTQPHQTEQWLHRSHIVPAGIAPGSPRSVLFATSVQSQQTGQSPGRRTGGDGNSLPGNLTDHKAGYDMHGFLPPNSNIGAKVAVIDSRAEEKILFIVYYIL